MSDSDLLNRFTARAPALAIDAPRVFAASRFVRETCARLLDDGESFAAWTAPHAPGTYADALAALARLDEDAALMRALRRYRRAEMARIAFRDIAGLAPLDETLADLSGLAEACIEAALGASERRLQARHGVPRDAQGEPIRPTVLGMGKLGGRELNFSSDVDLIFCHRAAGETDGARALSSDEYFAKLAQDVQKLLAAVTEDGFVFRVDLMLRPFGSAGALSASFAALEEYYQVHGREWERYALIKARPVAGDIEAGRGLLQALRPFVYRRYLDYSAIGSLRELKRLIADDVVRRGQEDNVKLGNGGIRELEFIVQSFQLVRGGAEAALRDTRLRPVLRYLGEAGHLDAAVAAELDEAYVFLRRLENAIQMYADQQTHALPRQDEARAALCAALDVADWAALEARLGAVRDIVQQQFGRIFAERGGEADGPDARLVRALWFGLVEADEALDALSGAGFGREPQRVLEAFDELRGVRLVRAMSEGAQQKLLVLLGALLAAAREQPQPETALCRTLGVVQALAGRSTYIALLHDNAVARIQLVRLCAASPWLTAFIAQSPVLLDTLLDPRTLYAPPDRDELRRELARRTAELAPTDTEAGMDLLRRYQKEMTLRIAAADLAGQLPLVQVSDRLTWLAEALVDEALQRAWLEMREQYGAPHRADGMAAGFAVIGYGKFGGIELGYGSDLDLVFLHDCDQLEGDTVGGARAINNGVFYARLAQRLINWLATQTPAGRAYEIDMELRPNGKSGLLVTSLASFAAYQRESAWTWEHQALTRARCVAGTAAIADGFAAVRREVLMRTRDAATLCHDIVDMRAKMRANLDKSGSGRWDVKQGEGGLIDIEFIAQYLVLRDAHRDAAIVEWSDNWRQLEALARAGSLDDADRDALIAAYRSLRAWTHAQSLQAQGSLVEASRFVAERQAVAALWRRILETAPS
ncbi:bifunctional [glutamate--ammonia ligase]-adenylyl-L-tyrosine phosphorylase/[glutamate--ammonia-ligase] adenylyltransferase [Solimonas variicoloris]|uniref:bifunctional [glutamate--ammonia ligase]-adenylyl-L-tyrosine phosphorylase/[glutamate--ammonia-ligase] adenylyltransferase n=1 Tax=Solimonas variicoloris TaxID=254408 RepID=UPI00037F80C6|nr:bifunctional [glutamate--ammonia ligase]-adenylyl-L-tyrosine phosphorylase/[glutamate--ammonia-ligase] adenylyltransferase [Solimonas variicoloris]